MSTNKKIRFITPNYEILFEVEDGSSVKLKYPDQKEVIKTAKYIDETHLYLGNNVYHICELAEKLQKTGVEVSPVGV